MSNSNYDSGIWDDDKLTGYEIGLMKGRLESAVRDLEGLDEEVEAMKRVSAEAKRLEFTV